MRHISICIPTYEMHGKGPGFLRQNFESFLRQSFRDFDVVVSDNAEDGSIKAVCDEYADKLDIVYTKNPGGKDMCDNTNNAIRHATGKILKILFMDDFLLDEHSLKLVADNFDLERDSWIATGYIHTIDGTNLFNPRVPAYHTHIEYGYNTLGTPSIIAAKNENPALFDNRFKWSLNDCDYYKTAFDRFGVPKIVPDVGVVIRQHESSVTNNEATPKARIKEFYAMLRKKNEHIWSHPDIALMWLKLMSKSVLRFVRSLC